MKSYVFGSIFSLEILENKSGFISFKVSGKKAKEVFKNEPGGHRWQRIPPTEKRGRVHTSTFTVAVMDPLERKSVELDHRDLEIKTTRGSGSGGQHRNKVETAVVIKHIPTGIIVRSEDSRSQETNKLNALEKLKEKLEKQKNKEYSSNRREERKSQVGSGQRGDKVRTIATQRDQVIDHITGRSTTWKKYSRGNFSDLL